MYGVEAELFRVQGREHEWLFATVEGQWAVAADCRAKRVILVILNRGHTFKGTAAVNRELSPLVRSILDSFMKHAGFCVVS